MLKGLFERFKPEPARYEYELAVAGTSFRQSECRAVGLRNRLDLVREPENKHDSNAVKVVHKGQQIGYVPAGKSRMTAEYLDAGKRVEASVADVTSYADDGGRPKMGVVMKLRFLE